MRTAVATTHLTVTPGKPVDLDVDVTNTADIIDGITATIQGLDPSWVSLVIPVVSLFPHSSATLSLRIDLPTNCLAGEYLVSVQVVSIIDPERNSEHEFWLTVEPLLAASLTMHPKVVIGGSHAVFQASIANVGNVTADVAVNAIDQTRVLSCLGYPATVSIPAGETHTVEVHVDGKRPWFGDPIPRPVDIEVTGTSPIPTANQSISLTDSVTFTQKPRIPRGALTIAILAGIIALWATVFLLVISALRETAPATKLTDPQFNQGGSGQVDLAAVASELSGIVTSQSTGEPLPLITVEAYRVKHDGSQELTGSAGTGDDGTFALESMLPGTYTLRFTADGFDEVWYPAATNQAGAEKVQVTQAEPGKDLNVVMVGKPGSMSGLIVAPESQGSATSISLEITQKIDNPVEGEPAPEPVSVPVAANGAFSLPNMTTPATYQLRVVAGGFDPRLIEETLGAGENKVVNTITLGAADGGFRGNVLSATGVPLGNVDVSVSSGDTVKATKTPTSGNVGVFVVDSLETPKTYTLTFSLAGYSDQTIAVDLQSGETRTVTVVLTGGQATVSGRVTDSGGTPIGGANVTVGCGTFSATTATLTSSSALDQSGTFSVANIPAPANCTIAVSNDGYVSQTMRVALTGAGVVTGNDIVLPRATGSVTGTAFVTTGATTTGVADVIVELSNGSAATLRSTVTTSSPAGLYRFTDVPPGDYTLTFRKSGIVTRVVIVTVTENETLTRDVTLGSS